MVVLGGVLSYERGNPVPGVGLQLRVEREMLVTARFRLPGLPEGGGGGVPGSQTPMAQGQ